MILLIGMILIIQGLFFIKEEWGKKTADLFDLGLSIKRILGGFFYMLFGILIILNQIDCSYIHYIGYIFFINGLVWLLYLIKDKATGTYKYPLLAIYVISISFISIGAALFLKFIPLC